MGRLRPQAINLAPLRRVRAWGTALRGCRSWHVRHERWLPGVHVRRTRLTSFGTRTHLTWSVYRPTQQIEVWPSPAMLRDCTYASVGNDVRPTLYLYFCIRSCRYWSYVPRRVWYKVLFKMGQDAGLLPRHDWRATKMPRVALVFT